MLLAQNLVCSLLYRSNYFIYSQRGLHINLLGLLFLYKVRGFFSHFIEMSYSRSVINEIFLLSTFQVFHKMFIKSLKTLLKNSCFCHYVCSCESKPILFAGYLLSVRITQPRGALQFSETLTFHHKIGSLMDVDSNNNLIKLFSADKI